MDGEHTNKKMTVDDMFREYVETLDRIDKQARKAREETKSLLNEQLRALQVKYHEDLKAIRAIQQKIRGKSGTGTPK